MSNFIEIKEPQQLQKLVHRLERKLSAAATSNQKRKIGYPRGSWRGNVDFLGNADRETLWWSFNPQDDRGLAVNLFGHANPYASNSLLIDIQFNVPVTEFHRRSGGAFLKDRDTGTIYLAHRGHVTLGHSRLKQDEVFATAQWPMATVEGRVTRNYFLIASLGSTELLDEISDFAKEMRRAAKEIGLAKDDDAEVTKAIGKNTSSSNRSKAMIDLRAYFKEAAGTWVNQPRGAVVVTRRHGDVVDSLKDALRPFQSLKSGPVDLATITDSTGLIFEVKTASNTQSIYTAIGQLMVHEPSIRRHCKGMKVRKVVVLPQMPSELLSTRLLQLGIECLIYELTKTAVKFKSLKDFLK
ncbi:hypothetical protein [uncultured Herbaspirillum sp.]|uniref:hypothetical protein n=1 Tax=uncultured Herbaspirillum sp. TaxID=160236 RepID=UPI00258525BB|nr:hypothetical protein [uncultured Herbaspirillum sp.]